MAARRVGKVLRTAGFLISPKSMLEPVRVLHFIGKQFDVAAMAVENKPGVIAGAVTLWLLGNACSRLSS